VAWKEIIIIITIIIIIIKGSSKNATTIQIQEKIKSVLPK
jgi:hypothetical protein